MLALTSDEIVEITCRVKKSAQCDALASMGIPFKIRPDGTPVVLRAVMEAAFGHATKNERPASPRLRLPEARSLLAGKKRQMDSARR